MARLASYYLLAGTADFVAKTPTRFLATKHTVPLTFVLLFSVQV